MVKRQVQITQSIGYQDDGKYEEKHVLSSLMLTPVTCPLNPGGWDEAPMPRCYEVDIEQYNISICCYWEGTVKNNRKLYTRCIWPNKIDHFEYHNYNMVREENF